MHDTDSTSKSWLIPTTPPPRFPHSRPQSGAGAADPPHIPPSSQRKRSRTSEERLPTPARLQIRRWDDPLVSNVVPANGFYTERYYGPIVGPTCLLLLRTLAGQLDTDQDGFTVETAELAASIGCSSKAGSNSQFWKALRRGIRFGLLRQVEDRVLVRTEISPLTARMVQRLPRSRRHEHRFWTATPDATRPTTHTADSAEPVPAIELLRLAARGLCTSEELRTLDRAHRLT